MYFQVKIARAGEQKFYFKMSGPGEGSFTAGMMATTPRDGETVILVTPKMEVLMEQEGTLRVSVSTDEKNWHTLIEKQVVKITPENSPFSQANASELPSGLSRLVALEPSTAPEPAPHDSPRKRRRS
jgi:hypothetical protein